jgi:cytoskeletal protein RodZ
VDLVDFGKYLTQQRELRGMTRAQVSNATRIPESVLVALETGQAERLPPRVFVVNYVRSYAQVIGLGPEEAVLRYQEVAAPGQDVTSPQELERRRRRRAWLILGGLSVGALGLGAALLLLLVR